MSTRGALLDEDEWHRGANCKGQNMFTDGAEQNTTKRICRNCPVKLECLAEALDKRIEFGVWGGKTERERRIILKQYPRIDSWRRLFKTG